MSAFFYFLFLDLSHWLNLSVFFIGNYLINYLATRGPKLQPFVTASLIQLLCRITKFGWFDDDRFRDVVKEATDFLSQVYITIHRALSVVIHVQIHTFVLCCLLCMHIYRSILHVIHLVSLMLNWFPWTNLLYKRRIIKPTSDVMWMSNLGKCHVT